MPQLMTKPSDYTNSRHRKPAYGTARTERFRTTTPADASKTNRVADVLPCPPAPPSFSVTTVSRNVMPSPTAPPPISFQAEAYKLFPLAVASPLTPTETNHHFAPSSPAAEPNPPAESPPADSPRVSWCVQSKM
jgi:hypothetical protein